MSVVGLPAVAPTATSRKALAAIKKQSFASQLPSSRGVDPTITTVAKKEVVEDEGMARPSKEIYDAEQLALKNVIDALMAKQNELKVKIAAVSGKGPDNDRRVALRAELDALRGEQARIKGGRGKTLDQVKALQDALSKKIQDLQAAKAKLSFKSVAEVDAQIKNLDRQLESGMMKLVDEKKALNEISMLRKTRKNVESFSTQQASIDADKAKIEAIRANMDNPEAKAISEKFNAVKAELDTIKAASDEANKGRDGLFEERNAISKELDVAFNKKKESAAAFRAANDKFYTKLNDDRAKRQERQRLERLGVEDAKRAEVNERLLEEAQAPAFEREIEDCRTLIDFFHRRLGGSGATTPSERLGNGSSTIIAGVAKLELRKVEDLGAPAGTVALKKKYEQEDEYFTGGKKGKKGPRKVVEGGEPAVAKNESLNLPFGTLSALLTLGIESPIVMSEIQKTIESLETKKKYFVDNQARVTKEKIGAVEKKIAAAEAKSLAASAPSGTSTPAIVATATLDAAPTPVVVSKVEKAKEVEEKEEGEIDG